MTSIKYKLRAGETTRQVAAHFGFSSTNAIAEHPENAGIVSTRGGIDHLVPGDVFTVPEGTQGRRSVGTGRGHQIRISETAGTFTLLLDTAFRLPDPDKVGDLAASPTRWLAFNTTLKISGATVKVEQSGGGLIYENESNKKGIAVFPRLDDGTWNLTAHPRDEELSSGPATADDKADHGLGFFEGRNKPSKSPAPKKSYPPNGTYEVEYRPMKLELSVTSGSISGVVIEEPSADENSPSPVVPFWKNVDETKTNQVVHVEWKPDFLRRLKPKLRPFQRKRADLPLELFVVHQTAGPSMGKALNSFLPPAVTSGAHFVNDVDGHLVRMVDDIYYSQHAGGYRRQREPNWGIGSKETQKLGRSVNDRAVGVENVHADNTKESELAPDNNPFTEAQYASLSHLIKGYISMYEGVVPRNVIGHQDATPKARCPGPHFVWEKLEATGASLAPVDLPKGEESTMFGGFFAEPEGSGRVLQFDDEQTQAEDGSFGILRGNRAVADKLPAGPVTALENALRAIGYGVDERIKRETGGRHAAGAFDLVLTFCLAQFMRHFCTGTRQRPDQYSAYLEVDLLKNRNRVFVDLELAKLIRRVELALVA